MRGSLLLLVGLCVAPLVAAGLALLYQNYQLQREVVEARAQLVASHVAGSLARERTSLSRDSALERLSAVLAAQNPPDSWLIALLDGTGNIAARSHEGVRYVGQRAMPEVLAALEQRSEGTLSAITQDGTAVLTAYTRLGDGGWTVVVSAPRRAVEEAQFDALLRLVLGVLAAVLAGVGIAAWVGRNVIRSVEDLNRAALQSAQGQEIEMPRMLLKEADAVGVAILRAADTLRQVKYMAHHDALTGLANRTLFFEMAEKQVALGKRHHSRFTIVALDLDGFKQVNDQHGHDAGDAVLKEVARRIGISIRSGDIAARLGGDEFMVLLNHADSDKLPLAPGRIVESLSHPYAGVDVAVSASAGVACFPQDGQDITTLVKAADTALYRAKASGKNQAMFA